LRGLVRATVTPPGDWISDSLDVTYSAFAEAGYHTIILEDGPNENVVIPDNTQVTVGGVAMTLATAPAATVDLLKGQLSATFDLIDYPFARRILWVQHRDGRPCGESEMIRQQNSTMTHELGHMMGLYHTGSGWQHLLDPPIVAMDPNTGVNRTFSSEYNKQPNYWSLMSYGVTIPVHALAVGTVVDGDMVMWPKDFPGSHKRPSHFSREHLIDLNEAELYEWNGLKGSTCVLGNCFPNTFTFDNRLISMDIPNPAIPGSTIAAVFSGDITVDWIDWNRSYTNTPGAVEAYDLDGDLCIENGGTVTTYTNPVTGVTSTDQNVCFDYLEGSNDIAYLEQADLYDQFVNLQPNGTRQYMMTTGFTDTSPDWPTICPYSSTAGRWWCGPTTLPADWVVGVSE
jgi:hypothetical protein